MSRWAWSAGLSRLKLKSLPGQCLPEAGTVCQEKTESYHAPAAWTDWQISFCLDKWAELHYTAASCEDFSLSVSLSAACSLFHLIYFLYYHFLPLTNQMNVSWWLEKKHRNWEQRHVCSPCCGWTFALSKKKTERKKEEEEEEGGKETVVLMLLEQQPTRMTKLRLKPFSPQLDSHECWKIEIVFLLSDVSNTSTNVSNGLCKPTV